MDCFAKSLRCLTHPLALGSIALLVLNDHVLKAIHPSVLTGKLSDFAGLFFFPFLLAAILSLVCGRLHLLPRCTAAVAFGFTILLFASIKLLPPANELMVSLLAAMTGLPVRIVRDPTDLIALLALWPAWRLWKQSERYHAPNPPAWVACLTLGLAAFATMATSCPPSTSVTRLEAFEGHTFATVNVDLYASSSDGGRTWTGFVKPPQQVLSSLAQSASLPLTLCAPEDPLACYRITGEEYVEASQDGGETWHIAWQVPPGRRRFMEAYVKTPRFLCQTKPKILDLTAHDMLILPEQDGGHNLIVAMGFEGVLWRDRLGEWHRVPVMFATPTPYTIAESEDLGVLIVTRTEALLSLAAAILLLWGLSALGWRTILSQIRLPEGYSAGWTMHLLRWVLAALAAAITILLLANLLQFISFVWVLILIPVFLFLACLVPILTWRRVAKVSPNPRKATLAGLISLLAAVDLLILAWLPFALWAHGYIAFYEVALGISLVLAAAAVVGNILAVTYLSKQALQIEHD